ncbi:MAG TPA: DUF5666 domain-containing protein [Marinagarivorans sp.]
MIIRSSTMWRALVLALSCAMLWSCGSGDNEKVAGIDGSGAPEPPIAPAPEDPITLPPPEEPVDNPPVPPEVPDVDITVAAQGTINGFGSIILHGERYDTSRANFYRHGMPVSEDAFEVGDMVGVTGYIEDGVLFAKDVFFDPVLSGRVEEYDEQEGTFTILGQTVKLDADTVIGSELDDKALWGENVTVSGWQGDGQVVATRLALSDHPETTIIRAHVKSNDPHMRQAYVGEIVVDYASVSNLGSIEQGDIVLFEGELIEPVNNPRYLLASKAVNISVTLSDEDVPLESVVVAGILRNIASFQRFTVNGVDIKLTDDSYVERGDIGDLSSGQLVIVRGTPTATDKMDARQIKIIEFASKLSFTGRIESVDADNRRVTVAGEVFDVTPATALTDLEQNQARLKFADIRVGDYLVVSAIAYEQGYEALSLKRTTEGVNDRKFDGTDVVEYDWGFPVGAPSASDGNNKLFSGRLHAAHPAMSSLEIGEASTNADKRLARIKIANDNYSKVFVEKDIEGDYQATLALLDELYDLLSDGRTVWINLQGDDRGDSGIFVDKLHYRVDREGPVIMGESLPEVPEAQ